MILFITVLIRIITKFGCTVDGEVKDKPTLECDRPKQ